LLPHEEKIMKADLITQKRFPEALAQRMAFDLKTKFWSFAPACAVLDSDFMSEPDWRVFGDYWNRMKLDRYMGDNGTYRYRRYSQFELADPDGALICLPHVPYEQPSYINRLNGDMERHFDPLEEGFIQNTVFDGLLRSLASVFNEASGETVNWNIRLHPYRILARENSPGSPTPEGLHRDGVDFIVTLMVKRVNVCGAETIVTDTGGEVVERRTLLRPMEILVADDARTMHEVTAIERDVVGLEAYRDVLVIAYTREA
jgi:hypothetical protein